MPFWKWKRLESSLIYIPKWKPLQLYLVVFAFCIIMELWLKQTRHHRWELVVLLRRMLCGVEQDCDSTSVCEGYKCEKPHKKMCRINVRRKISLGKGNIMRVYCVHANACATCSISMKCSWHCFNMTNQNCYQAVTLRIWKLSCWPCLSKLYMNLL